MDRVHALLTSPLAKPTRQPSRRRSGSFRPILECLEERQLPATLFLTPLGHDATHFSSFTDAYNTALHGDIIQVEPGAVISDPSGTIHIDKSITIQGDPKFGRARVANDMSAWTRNAAGLILRNLNF